METFHVLRDCRLASGDRYRAGAEASLSPGAAKYPLLRGWIARPAPADPPADPPSGQEAPGRRRRRGG